ncbi:hypothetical protein EDD11_006652 [Mortierella claussenii]|nr:hypothetical protein EDD11_006652 [Mortierella claussenii]
MASPPRGQRPIFGHDASEDTIWEDPAQEQENAPLLQDATSSSAVSAIDSTTVYTKILSENLPWHKRPSAVWLLPVYGLTSISGGMLMSSVGQFQTALLCQEYLKRHSPANATAEAVWALTNTAASILLQATSNNPAGLDNVYGMGEVPSVPAPECQSPDIQAYTAKTMAVMEVLGGIAATLSIGYYASLSDKHGRIKIMAIGLANTLFMLISLIIMGRWWDQVGLPFMALAKLVYGLLGGMGIGGTMSLAYAADCTDPSKRSLVYSWLHAGLFMGLAVGPFIGGLIVKVTHSFLMVVYLDIVATIVAFLILVFLVPESLPARQLAYIQKLYEQAIRPNDDSHRNHNTQYADDNLKKSSTEQRVGWHSHMLRSLRFFKPNGRNTNLILLAAISFLQMLALKGTLSVLILYTNRVFNWTQYEDGILFSLGSVIRLVSLLLVLPVMVHFYHKWAAHRQNRKGKNSSISNDANNSNKTSQPRTYAVNSSYGSRNDNSNDNNNTLIDSHPERVLIHGLEDPVVASSVEHLGEAALNLSDDEESFQERRRRQSTVDSVATWSSDRTRRPSSSWTSSPSPPSMLKKSPSTQTAITVTGPTKPSTKTSSDATTTPRTKEQKMSDLKLDTWIIRLGSLINSLTYIGYGLATQSWHFYLWSSLHAVSIISSPSLKSLLTHLVEPSQFGAVLGAFQVVDSIAGIFSPVLISWVYASTVGTRPESVWYCCAILTGICVVLAFMIRQRQFYSPGTLA